MPNVERRPPLVGLGFGLPPITTPRRLKLAREKNTTRAEARRRSRAVARDTRVAQEAGSDVDVMDAQAVEAAAPRTPMFKFPNVAEDIRALPEMFRTKRTLWIPFIVLIAAFFVALGLPYNGVDQGIVSLLLLFFQMAFLPQGLIIYLVGGFLAPRASYLVGFLLGLLNTLLLFLFVIIRSDFFLDTSQGGDPAASPGNILPVLIGYALFIGPLAAAFAAWYRGFLNRMNSNSAARRKEREDEARRKKRDQERAAKKQARTAATTTTTKAAATDTKPTT